MAFEQQLDAIAHDPLFAGLEIVQHHARPVRGSLELSVTIDRPGGADLALCERVAARINASLVGLRRRVSRSRSNPPGSTARCAPGPITSALPGQRARIVTTLTVNGGKTHRGMLRGLRGEAVVVETERGELPLPIAAIKSANLEYDPRADFQRDKLQRKQSHGNNRKHGN